MEPSSPAAIVPIRRYEYLGLALILLFAAVLRLGWPGINSFSFDEARVSLLALQMARQGQIPAVGIPSSAGIPNPPAFVWLMAIPFALSRDPLVATLFVGGLSVLSVLGLWALARRAWGPWSALTAGLLYAGAPYSVLYARSIWSQDLMAPLAILWAWCAVQAVERRRPWAIAGHFLVAGLAWQVHYSGAVLIPFTLWLDLRYRLWARTTDGKPKWIWLLLGGVVPVATVIPFASALLRSGTGSGGLRALIGQPANWSVKSFVLWAQVGAGHAWEWLLLGWDWRWAPVEGAAQTGARLLTATLILAGLLAVCVRVWRVLLRHEHPSTLDELVLVWALATPVFFLRSGTPVYHQYMLGALPALALLASRPAQAPDRRWQGPAVLVAACAIALVQGWAVAASVRANASELHPGGMGTPLLYPRNVASLLRDGAPVYTHARSDAAEFDADASAMRVLFWGYPHRVVNGEAVLLLPPDGERTHLLFMFSDSPALAVARQLSRVKEEREIPRRTGEPPYTVLDLTGLEPGSLTPGDGQTLENGLAFLGWRATRVGDTLHILTCWQVLDAYAPGRYHQFNHLYAAGGKTPLEVQDASLSSGAWEAGNVLVSWATFPIREVGPYEIEIGMYTFPELARVPLSAAENALRLGPIP
ncbi:MAG: ArnT family glycosyltransferase [Anaerolineae bacterium]